MKFKCRQNIPLVDLEGVIDIQNCLENAASS